MSAKYCPAAILLCLAVNAPVRQLPLAAILAQHQAHNYRGAANSSYGCEYYATEVP